MKKNIFHFFLIICFLSIVGEKNLSHAKDIISKNSNFLVVFDSSKGGITSIKRTADVYDTEYIKSGHLLGNLTIHYRIDDSDWQKAEISDKYKPHSVEIISLSEYKVEYAIGDNTNRKFILIKHFILKDENLLWNMELRNVSNQTIELGDIALPLRMNTDYIGGDLMDENAVRLTYQNRLNRHRLIAGYGSFIYWMRANGVGPFLVMTLTGNTKLEYFDTDYVAYINSAYTGGNETRGTWRQKHTSTILAPKGEDGDSANFGFKFAWGKDYDGVRDVLYKNGAFDVNVVPGMVLPANLSAKFSLRTRNQIKSVTPEYPGFTKLEYLGEKEEDLHIYEVKFSKLGENIVTINYKDSSFFILEFYCTEPLETLYKKRANFITNKQQHRNDKWYNGLFSLWDMKDKVLRSPDNKGELSDYMVGGSDDPSNSKCVYLAEKNVVHPDATEIAALEYFIENFVWGKHQRTDQEYPHPYGIYGSENWYLNRNTEWGTTDEEKIKRFEKQFVVPVGTGLGRERMWRTFDYTTYMMLYYNMYLIAKSYPDLVGYLDAAGYLERTFGTAKAYFQVPYSIYMLGKPLWSHHGFSDWAYKLGNFHEKYITEVIESLRSEGMNDKADWLNNEWEKKVKYFIYDDPNPFGSEFVFDRTAFESTHAVARYAIENPMKPDVNLWWDKNLKKWYSHPEINQEDCDDFLERQTKANIAMRGWLETSYYYLGSARVGGSTLDYMSQMAGWSILDYALYYSEEPAKYARLGYASILSSWALVNSGTPESDYGYWYPGKENDGAVGWNFQTQKYGGTWAHGNIGRGPWNYDGEIDHGLAGGLKAAATVVIEDPIFGRIAYGGDLQMKDGNNIVTPKDGVRRRFHYVNDENRFHMHLNKDGFAKDKPIIVNDSLDKIQFLLENRSNDAHETTLYLSGLVSGRYKIEIDGKTVSEIEIKNNKLVPIVLKLNNQQETAISLNKTP